MAQMEALLQQPASRDRGETQKDALRKWYDADVKGFMGQLAGLKKEQMRTAGNSSPCPECTRRKAEEEADEGTERAALAVLDEIISRCARRGPHRQLPSGTGGMSCPTSSGG